MIVNKYREVIRFQGIKLQTFRGLNFPHFTVNQCLLHHTLVSTVNVIYKGHLETKNRMQFSSFTGRCPHQRSTVEENQLYGGMISLIFVYIRCAPCQDSTHIEDRF